MKAVLLAGGKGSRLAPLTAALPKPLVRVLDKPVMAYTLALLSHYGVHQAAATLGYLAGEIEDAFGERFSNVYLKYFREEVPLGTAGGVKTTQSFLLQDPDDSFFVLSGDAMCDFDLQKALAFHRSNRSDVTLLLTRHSEPLEFGLVRCDPSGRVVGFVEKPEWSQVCSDLVNTGIYIIRKSILERIPSGVFFDFSHDLFPALLADGFRIFGCHCEGYWRDIGSVGSYMACNRDALYQRVKLHLPLDGQRLSLTNGTAFVSYGCRVDERAYIGDGAILGRECTVGAGSSVQNSVLNDSCTVGRGCTVACSVLDRGVVLEDGAFCHNSVVGTRSVLHTGVALSSCVLAQDSTPGAQACFWEQRHPQLLADQQRLIMPRPKPEALFALGIALAKTGAPGFVLASSQTDMDLFPLIKGLCRSGAGCHLVNAGGFFPLRFTAVTSRAWGIYVTICPQGLCFRVVEPSGQDLAREARKRLIREFTQALGQNVPQHAPQVLTLDGQGWYQAALLHTLPQLCPSARILPEDSWLATQFHKRSKEEGAPIALSLGENGLGMNYAGHEYGWERLQAFLQKHAAPTDPALSLEDQCFVACLLLRQISRLGLGKVLGLLEKTPASVTLQRFWPSAGSFLPTLNRLMQDPAARVCNEGVAYPQSQGSLRIVPSGLQGFRIYARAVREELAQELCRFAENKLESFGSNESRKS